MKYSRVPARNLTPQHLRAWSEIQQSSSHFDSPYYCPQFTQALASVRDDVEVGVLHDGGEPAGFFPFQRLHGNCGIPAAADMSDFHAAIVAEGIDWRADELIRGCGLASWSFHHLAAWQTPFEQHHLQREISPYIELGGPFPSCESGSARVGPSGFHDFGKKWRKFCREVGELRFVHDIRDDGLFKTLIDWKREQYERTNVDDIFAAAWRRSFLKRILDTREDDFGGVLSALYVGERPVAIHAGLRSRTVLHSWFPVYDPELSQYSPGLLMFCELCKAAAAAGLVRLDLGKGTTRFKTSLMTGSSLVAEGAVDLNSLQRSARKLWYQTCDWIRGSRLRPLARAGASVVRPVRRWFSSEADKSPQPAGISEE